MKRIWLSFVSLALASLLIASTAFAAFPGRNGRIAFERFSLTEPEGTGESRLVRALIAADASGPGRYTLRTCTTIDGTPQSSACGTSFSSPAYSPRGARLAVDAGGQLATMASDGSGFRLLAQQTADDGEPAWSPDGKRIAFTGSNGSGSAVRDLYVLDVAAGTSRLIARDARMPVWSSSNRIAYVVRFSDAIGAPRRGQVATIRPDGSRFRQLTRKGGLAPAWSPHASKIAFVRRDRLWVMNANGKRARRIGGRRGISADDVAWSPNGRRFAVHAFESGFVVMRTNGTGGREIESGGSGSDYHFDNFAPDWQPLPRRR